MYLIEEVKNIPKVSIAMTLLSQPVSLEQWHRRLTHCSPTTITEMATKNLVDGLKITGGDVTGKCEDCILGRQTRRPFDGETEKNLLPLDLVSFHLCINHIWTCIKPTCTSNNLFNMSHFFASFCLDDLVRYIS